MPQDRFLGSLKVPKLGCLRKWLLEFRESRNFIRKWSYFREISSNFVYFRITFYTTFRIIWHDFHTKFRIPSNKNLTNNKCLWNLGLYWVLKLYKNKRNWNSNPDPKSIFSNGIRNKKNIRNIRNFENTKCRKHPTGSSEGVGVEGCTVVPPPPPISVLKFLCCV
jgi:hypothetical protein